MTSLIARTLVSGATAAAAAMITAAIAGRFATGSYTAPINATGHITWGKKAAQQNTLSLKYTGMGALLNYAGSIFWALFYEGLAGGRRTPGHALLRGAIISTAAYITDYHLVSRRFTPGFEKRLPGGFLAPIYGAFAIGLCIRDLMSTKSVLKTRAGHAARRIRSALSARKTQPTLH